MDDRRVSNCRKSCFASLVAAALAFASIAFGDDGKQAQHVRDMLALHGIDHHQLEQFQNGEPLADEEEGTLVRMLDRYPRFPLEKLSRWSHAYLDFAYWEELAAAPAEHQGAVLRFFGTVTRVETRPLPPEVAKRLPFREYYRVTIGVIKPYVLTACVRDIPAAWKDAKKINESAGVTGIFLKTGTVIDGIQELVLVADRVAWMPDRLNPELGTTPGMVQLAKLGFDVGLLDHARAQSSKPLSYADRECFYQMLVAMRDTDKWWYEPPPDRPMNLISLLQDPTKHHGDWMTVEGIARRVTKVVVEDKDIRDRLKLDHYFQIDLFVNLDTKVVKLRKRDGRAANPVYENSYPVTVCVLEVPEELEDQDPLRENVKLQAAFFKLWTYESDYVASFDKSLLQISPMLIGANVEVVSVPVMNPGFGIGLAALVLVSLVAAWFALRRSGKSSDIKRFHMASAGAEKSTENPLPERPDFSGLE